MCDSASAAPDGYFPRLISRFDARTLRERLLESDPKQAEGGSRNPTRWNRVLRWKIQREVESGGRINGYPKSLQDQFADFLRNPEENLEAWDIREMWGIFVPSRQAKSGGTMGMGAVPPRFELAGRGQRRIVAQSTRVR